MGIAPHGSSHNYVRNRLNFFGIDTEHFLGRQVRRGTISAQRLSPDEILVLARLKDRKESGARLRRALIESGRLAQCEGCSCGEQWNGRPLRLQVDHRDGNPLNNQASNLRFLCPNCHSQTSNFGVLNIKPRGRRVRLCLDRGFGDISAAGAVKVRRGSARVQVDCAYCTRRFERAAWRVLATNNYCSYQCSAAGAERTQWPMDHELKDMIWERPATQVARALGVSSSGLKKRCRLRKIETPPRGYWARLRAQAAA